MLSNASRVSSLQHSDRHPRVLLTLCAAAIALAIALLACALLLPGGARAEALPTNCDKVASPQGSDSAAGTAAAPLRSAQALVEALAPGQVGCLRAGSYGGGLRPNHGGRAGAPLTLISYPGEQAQVTGRIYVPRGSDYVTIANLSLDGAYQSGTPLPSPNIAANHITFESDDVTNDHTEICFDIGSAVWGKADSTTIANNRIHDCGLLPSRNQDHGIYVQDATNTRIVGNLIDHNVDRGIQFYPSAQGSVVMNNVIADNGEGVEFGGAEGVASSNNLVEHNLIVNSNIRGDVESWYPAGNPVGVGNVVQNNCVSGSGINTYSGGFSAHANVTAGSAELIATVAGGFLPAKGSACAGLVPEIPRGIAAQGVGSVQTPSGKEGAGTAPAGSPTASGSAHGASNGAGTHPTGHGSAKSKRFKHAKRTSRKDRVRKHGHGRHAHSHTVRHR
jgi:parallel beta-helix repeat protein